MKKLKFYGKSVTLNSIEELKLHVLNEIKEKIPNYDKDKFLLTSTSHLKDIYKNIVDNTPKKLKDKLNAL